MSELDDHEAHTIELDDESASLGAECLSPVAEASRASVPMEGERVGRFLVIDELGAGAMGVVVLAYDPELGRRVALKLVKPKGSDPLRARARLQREAMALAQLNHHNVVTVYDVGVHEGRVFLAMEYIEGQTLREWMRGGPRSWREVVEVFAAAAKGLGAAHAVGLVHRDFKPDNVMLGDDGQIRVMDFGLARIGSELEDGAASSSALELLEMGSGAELGLGSASGSSLTRTGSLLGTPAYMAPEQLLRQPATPHSDQFAFCVSLHEALYGSRPFRGRHFNAVAAAILAGRRSPPPSPRQAPAWLDQVIRRGLATRPEERFPDMDTLHAVLASVDLRLRRRRALGAVLGLGLIAGVGGSWKAYERMEAELACVATRDEVDEVWNATTRAGIRAQLSELMADEGHALADRILPWLDVRAEGWQHAAYELCRATKLEREWSAEREAKARWCLDGVRRELGATASGLANADRVAIARGVSAASSFVPARVCLDELGLDLAGAPPPIEEREAIASGFAELAELRYLRVSGQTTAGLERAEALTELFADLSWAPLELGLDAERVSLLVAAGSHREAAELGRQTYYRAAKRDNWTTAASVANVMIQTYGHVLGELAEGERWAELAELAIVHAGDPLGAHEARRQTGIGALRFSDGRLSEARDAFQVALAGLEAVYGEAHPAVAAILGNLAMVHGSLDEREAALALHQRQVEIMTKIYGPEHLLTLQARQGLAGDYMWLRDFERAVPMFESVIAALEQAHGPEHLDISVSLIYLAAIAHEQEDFQTMLDHARRALTIGEKAVGREHRWTATNYVNIADALVGLERWSEAEQAASEALAIAEGLWGPDSHRLGSALSKLGLAQLGAGEHALALATFGRGLELDFEALDPEIRADLQFGLARTLWEAPSELEADRAEAGRLLDAARSTYVELGIEGRLGLSVVERWLAARGRGIE